MNQFLSYLENRADLLAISDWIKPSTDVLDLGCGEGVLLDYLIREKKVRGMGVEISLDRIAVCLKKGIPVVEHDLNLPFAEMQDKTYDYVILSQTIQEVSRPDNLIEEILRIGRYGIISFPNFGNIRIRANLLFSGRMPKSRTLPFEWYDTPNIHLLTLADFKQFCKSRGIRIEQILHIASNRYWKSPFFPNLFSEGCVVLISK